MQFKEGEAIVIISASLDNTYLLFGFKETPLTIQRKVDRVEVFAVESTTVKPTFEIYPPGIRVYTLSEFNSLGQEEYQLESNIDLLTLDIMGQGHLPGEIPVLSEMFLACKNFNPDENELPFL